MAPSKRLVLVCALALACDGIGGSTAPGPRDGWNLLLITLDTTRADFVSSYGGPPGLTPNLDALARSGCRFANAFSQSNVTNPSHVSIMTGLPLLRHRVFDNRSPLRADVPTLPLLLKQRGFETVAIAAIPHVLLTPDWQGFDQRIQSGREERAPFITRQAITWLGSVWSRERPFFAWVHYFDPHMLYEPPAALARELYPGDPKAGSSPPILERPYFRFTAHPRQQELLEGIRDEEYPRAMYAAEIQFMDRSIGRLLRALEELGIADDTVVVVVGDHGESLGEHGIFYDHVGIYETQVRVPFIVRVPGFPPGLDAEHSVTHLDIAPTIAELFALELEAGPGSSLVPSLRGERDGPAAPDEVLIQETSANRQVAVRRGGWKLIWPIASAHVLSDVPELYDLDSDPDETRNLAREHPARVAELKRYVEPWLRLGFVEPFADLDPESLDALRSLGYVR